MSFLATRSALRSSVSRAISGHTATATKTETETLTPGPTLVREDVRVDPFCPRPVSQGPNGRAHPQGD